MRYKTYIRFEHAPDGRASENLGPFEWFQLTYDVLRVSPDGSVYAHNDSEGLWRRVDEPNAPYTDMIIWGE